MRSGFPAVHPRPALGLRSDSGTGAAQVMRWRGPPSAAGLLELLLVFDLTLC